MTIYDQCYPHVRAIIDALVDRTGEQDWQVRRAYLTSVMQALQRGSPQPEEDLAVIIAGLVERLGEPEIAEPLQAGIYAASAKPEHRIWSGEWFDRHPAEYALILRELDEGPRLN